MTDSLSVLRDSIKSEILSNTNKPRFCYMGFAPPLCIGDDFDKPSSTSSPIKSTPMRVSYPKKGTGPDSCFSLSTPLCVGDLYVDKWKIDKRNPSGTDRRNLGIFKPAGGPSDVPILTYIPSPPPQGTRVKNRTVEKFFLVSTVKGGGLFSPQFEYMSSVVSRAKKSEDRAPGPPFRSTGVGREFFADYQTVVEKKPLTIVDKEQGAKTSEVNSKTNPFKPAGKSGISFVFPGYISPVSKSIERAKANGPSWRCASMPLLSSPTSSIAMNPLNLNHHCA